MSVRPCWGGGVLTLLGEMENLFDIKDWSDDDVESGGEDRFAPDLPKLFSQGSPLNVDDY